MDDTNSNDRGLLKKPVTEQLAELVWSCRRRTSRERGKVSGKARDESRRRQDTRPLKRLPKWLVKRSRRLKRLTKRLRRKW